LEREGSVARLTVERPEKLNALDLPTIAGLTEAATALQRNDALRAVVLTGAGERAFIGGADVVTLSGLDAHGARAFITALHDAITAVRAIPVPVIARVNGYCLGAGLEVAIACDLRVAAAHAQFGMPEVKVGMPSVIEAALLPRLIGWGKAAELVLLGESIDAAEALRVGLIEKMTSAAELDSAVDAWIESLLAAGPQAVRQQKALMRQWERLPLDAAIEAGIASFRASYAGDEPRRMLAQFLNKR
jgi:enoyl-CoA hydratase